MLNFKNSLNLSADPEPEESLRNFWDKENGFAWSKGKWCEVEFGFELAEAKAAKLCDLILDIDVFRHEGGCDGQDLMLYLNGLRIGSLYCTAYCTVVFSFDAGLLKERENILTIDTPDSTSPSQFGGSDGRKLGVQFFSLQIRRVESI